jgi:hypothetical protein
MKRALALFLTTIMVLSTLPMTTSGAHNYGWGEPVNGVDGGYVGPTDYEEAYIVEVVGDIDHDGKEDIAIGAPNRTTGGFTGGAVYLLYSADPNWDNSDAPLPWDRMLYSDVAGDLAGTSIARAGDVNGDGKDDFVVGVPGNDTGGNDAGAAYLVFGRGRNEWQWSDWWSLNNFIPLYGENAGDMAGSTVGGNTDVNMDGYDDILVGAPFFDKGAVSDCGKVYVIYGRHKHEWPNQINLSQANASYIGDQNGEQIGTSLHGAWDVNGDGYDDIAMGSPEHERTSNAVGITYVVFGSDALLVNASIADKANASIAGDTDGERFGHVIEGNFDMDGNGLGDLLVGAPRFTESASQQGAVFVIYGNRTGWSANMTFSNLPYIYGDSADDHFGTSIAALGDNGGDRLDDYAVGAPDRDSGGVDRGEVYLFYGSWGQLSGANDVGSAIPDCNFKGMADSDLVGSTVTGGDINGDGFNDVVFGAPLQNGTGEFWVAILNNNAEHMDQEAMEIYTDEGLNRYYHEVPLGQKVFVYVETVDPSGSTANMVRAVVNSSHGSNTPLEIWLHEGAVGEFIGNFTIMPEGMTNQHRQWIGAKKGETITVELYHNNSNSVFINVTRATIVDDSYGMIKGEEFNRQIGDNIEVLGDLNGDGIDDFAISNSESNQGGDNTGRVYLYFGRTEGFPFGINITNADVKIIPDTPGVMFGSYVGGGDVNNDGLADLVIGAPLAFNKKLGDGSVYIIFGREDWPSGEVSVGDIVNVTYYGENTEHGGGFGVVTGADVNGDGIDDILTSSIAAPGWDFTGWVYLILGHEDPWPETETMANATARWKGAGPVEWAGYTLDMGGDFNGDEIGDILIGAYGNDAGGTDAGATYVIYGRRSGWKMDWNLTNDYNLAFHGGTASPNNKAGYHVAFAGDLNLDNVDDIVIQSGFIDHVNFDGRQHIIYGRDSWGSKNHTISSIEDTLVTACSHGAEMEMGREVGDYDGDLFPDLALTCPHADMTYYEMGMVTLIHAKQGSLPAVLNASEVANLGLGEVFWGDIEQQKLGSNVAGGDVNGDGWLDLLIGARGSYDEDLGRVYIVTRGTNSRPSAPVTLKGYTNWDMTEELGEYRDMNHEVFLQLSGTDTDPTVQNMAEVHASSMTGDPHGIRLTLLETTPSSGVFEGWMRLKETDTLDRALRVIKGDHVTVEWVQDPTVNLTFKITSSPDLDCDQSDFFFAREDVLFEHHYTVENTTIYTMTFESDHDYIHWDEENMTVWGLPNNTHVGQGAYDLSVLDDQDRTASEHVSFFVRNNPPDIIADLSANVTNLTEDQSFEIDLNSSDDGQGTISWAYTTNASSDWQAFNQTTGIFNGTPTNDEVGSWWFNFSVNDGNDGVDWENVTINVSNTNDLPYFESTPPDSGVVGLLYTYIPVVVDVDVGDVLTFGMDTPMDNMTINEVTGVLNWVPTENHGGQIFTLILNVSDGTGNVLQEFNVTIVAPGEIPMVSLESPQNGSTVEVTNPELKWKGEAGDNVSLTFNLYFSTNEGQVRAHAQTALKMENMTAEFYRLSGLVKGTTYFWTVVPYHADIKGICLSGFYTFTVSSEAVSNNPPTILGTPIEIAYAQREYKFQVNATDPDPYDTVTFSLEERPTGMYIDPSTGMISWTPALSQLGVHNVTVVASDGKASSRLSWTITVRVWGNKLPYLTTPLENRTAKVGELLQFTVPVFDDDGDDLYYSLGPNSPEGASINPEAGQFSWAPTKDQLGNYKIEIIVSDGKDQVSFTFNVTVKEKVISDDGMKWYAWASLIGMPIALILIVAAIALRRRKMRLEAAKKMTIDDIFLISTDGRLIAHHARTIRPDMDGELLGGMFTAVQDFIGSSFKPDQDGEGSVNEIRYGDYRVLLEHGKYVFLAVSAKGEDAKPTIASMKDTIQAIETRFKDVLEMWDGDVNPLKDARKAMAAIITEESPWQKLGIEKGEDDTKPEDKDVDEETPVEAPPKEEFQVPEPPKFDDDPKPPSE